MTAEKMLNATYIFTYEKPVDWFPVHPKRGKPGEVLEKFMKYLEG